MSAALEFERKDYRGRPPKAVDIGTPRELTVDDLLQEPAEAPTSVVRIRTSHHQVARLVAQGMESPAVAAASGYTPARVNQLKADPTFQELVAYYSTMEEEEYRRTRADMHDRLAALGFDAQEVLHERLLENPESITDKMLLQILSVAADRTGYGPTSTLNANVSHSLTPADIERLKASSSAPAAPLPQETRQALLMLAVQSTSVSGEQASTEGKCIEGHIVSECPVPGASET